jgi:hypothetical protein
MDKVTEILNNPVIRRGLMIASPEIAAFCVELITLIGSSLFKKRDADVKDLLNLLDAQLAEYIEKLATTESSLLKEEMEIRIHTILHVMMEWNKID